MPKIDLADALTLAINLLRDAAESHSMPCGVELDDRTAELHADAADVLAESRKLLNEHEG
ncbi:MULTISPECIES: hypothetical protein [Burkholderia cepacia complex]|uniref:hypothetical protein n=1 Tax=Burkholderia cepacia complex TaxID=87882 RepID=UPI0005BE0349|nr:MULTISPECIES: hypothetical protein [Burkholderia cepacia complex]MCA7889898.1 hypothetical protein [Burkholderia contaminans]MCB4349679.1 hypothetical protein [Burkholderia vietnamiensis]MDN7670469.1 hypothetical protein [Burkholderia vietnamiensis]MDN8102676.1 hypothetical protein [Burkholderia multivorans]